MPIPAFSRHRRFAFVICVASALLTVGCGLTEPQVTWTPVTTALLDGHIAVPAGKQWHVDFEVPASVRNARIAGRFQVSGGSGNDVVAVVASHDDYLNWANGHSATTLYSTEQTTTGTVDLALKPDQYTLGFSNAFSVISDKDVEGKIVLSWERPDSK